MKKGMNHDSVNGENVIQSQYGMLFRKMMDGERNVPMGATRLDTVSNAVA